MKKIIILSYYFPPCNLTPAERVFSWAKYFHENGYYPIIITRNWDRPIKESIDEHFSSGDKIKHEVHDTHEVYYIPYKNNLKNKFFIKFSGTSYYTLYLMIAFIYSILENFTSSFTSLQPLYKFLKTYLKQHKEIKLMLISANPFHQFKFGYLLNKKLGIKWIADYRDDWNTNEFSISKIFFKKIIKKISTRKEKKWVKSASFFTSVSSRYVKKIKQLVGIDGYVIENGFMPENYEENAYELFSNFTVTYVGSLYPSQPIEIFLNTIKKFINTFSVPPPIKIIFIGILADPISFDRIKKYIKGYESYFQFTHRIDKKEAIEVQKKSHLLIAVSYIRLKGIPGSKLYEYLAIKKLVLVCPTDNDIIEEILTKTGQGIFVNNQEECLAVLESLYQEWIDTGIISMPKINEIAILNYSRRSIAKSFTSLIDLIN
jgi:glycosyltransferase involved in cell wall biosynthesis